MLSVRGMGSIRKLQPGHGGFLNVYNRIGLVGVLGILTLIAGMALLALVNLQIAAGVGLAIAGVGLVAYGLVSNLLAAFGL